MALAVMPMSIGVLACGSSARSVDVPSTAHDRTALGYVRGDGDADSDDDVAGLSDRADPGEDAPIRAYGHEAPVADRRSAAKLVRGYLAVAAAKDGTQACALVYSRLAKGLNFTDALPRYYAPAPGSPVMRDKTCPEVVALLFGVDHRQLVAEAPSVEVTALRVAGSHGLALLAFTTAPESVIAVQREGKAWKIDELLDEEIP